MSTLLQINSSARAGGESSRLANDFTQAWRHNHPEGVVVLRDLTARPVPHLDEPTLNAFSTPPEQRDASQREAVRLSDELIAEIQAADVIVMGVPMYNFGIPSTLKAYFDHIARAGITFQYTANGPQGLLTGKRAIVLAARGGIYSGTPKDTQSAYLRDFLAFIGITELEFVYAEGLAMGEEQALRARQQAAARIAELSAVLGGET
ncbi:MAG: FMN-dependent NADH-azoreductase [Pseudomonadota bacterium]